MEVTWAVATRAKGDAPHCGDAGAAWPGAQSTLLCMADGLGHGPAAERAALAALECVGAHAALGLEEIVALCDRALAGTRGVALGLCRVDHGAKTLTWCGVGNVRGRKVGGREVSLASYPGIVGGGYRTLKSDMRAIRPGDWGALFTDGLAESLELPGAVSGDLQAHAGAILRAHGSAHDDAGILLWRVGDG